MPPRRVRVVLTVRHPRPGWWACSSSVTPWGGSGRPLRLPRKRTVPRARVTRNVDRDARLGVEGHVGLRGQVVVAGVGAVGDAVAPRRPARDPEREAPVGAGGDRAAVD